MNHGDYYWHELMTSDTAKCQAFYTGLFGWTTQDFPMGEGEPYKLWVQGDKPSGGMMRLDPKQFASVPPHWMIYVKVDDCDAAVAKVKTTGGAVKHEPFDVPNIGRIAIIADPTGAMIGIITPVASPAS